MVLLPDITVEDLTDGDPTVILDQESGYFLSLHLIAIEGSAEDFEGRADFETPPPATDAPPTKKRWLRR